MSFFAQILFSVVLCFCALSHATGSRVVSETGRASESGYCSSNGSSLCLNSIKDRAERAAEREALMYCQTRGGSPRTYTARKSTFCNPNYLPPNSPSTWVTCRSEYQMDCEYKD